MHKSLVLATALGVGLFVAACQPLTPEERARRVMTEATRGDYRRAPGERPNQPKIATGWIMTNERGEQFHRAGLNDHAEHLVLLGRDAVPELLRWLDHDEMQIRYMAQYALEKITGQSPYFPHFATLEEHRAKGWLDEAKRVWQDWYAKTSSSK